MQDQSDNFNLRRYMRERERERERRLLLLSRQIAAQLMRQLHQLQTLHKRMHTNKHTYHLYSKLDGNTDVHTNIEPTVYLCQIRRICSSGFN